MPSWSNFSATLKDYLNSGKTFENFSTEHWITLAISFSLVVIIPIYAKLKLNKKQQNQLGSFLGILITGTYILSQFLMIWAGTYDIMEDLPLQLCRFANLGIVLVMVWKRFFWFEILYFWAMAGMFQASFTTNLSHSFPHWYYFRYWLAHPGIILCVIYAVLVYGFRPKAKSMLKAIIAMNVFMLIVIPFNFMLNTNYLWICRKPVFATIIDYCGPWPWYILVLEVIAIAHFLLAYLPFYIMERKRKRVE